MTVNQEIIVLMFAALGAEADEKMGGDMRGESSRNVLQHYLSVIRVKCKKQTKEKTLFKPQKIYSMCLFKSFNTTVPQHIQPP